LPVFVTEEDVTEPVLYVHELKPNGQGRMEVMKLEIKKDNFYKIAQNPLAKHHLWLELVMPFKHLNDSTKSFVLLPGFEGEQSDLSQHLLNYVLEISNTSILVIQKDTFAQEDTYNIALKVKELFQNTKPIIALSFSELQTDTNQIIKQQVQQLFNIKSYEQDRVILTGTSKELDDVWPQQIQDAINKYAAVGNSSNEVLKQSVYTIAGELELISIKVESILDPKLNEKQFEERKHLRVLNSFERETDAMLNQIENQIKDVLSTRKTKAQVLIDDYLAKNNNFFSELRTKVIGQNLKDLKKINEALILCWNEAEKEGNTINPKIITPENQITEVIYRIVNDNHNVSLIQKPEQTVEEEHKDDSENIFDVTSKREETSLVRINNYFDSSQQDLPQALKQDDYRALALIGTYLLANSIDKNELKEHIIDQNQKNHEFKIDLKPQDLKVMENLDNLSKVSPHVLKLIPIILGVDVALDGEADILTMATASLGVIGIKLTSLQLLGIVGAGIAVVYATKAIQEGIAGANKRQIEYSALAKQVYSDLPDIQAKGIRQSLQNIFDNMGLQLRERHLQYSGVFDEVGELEQVQYAVRKVKQQCKKMKKEYYNNALLH
jgi:hypothetical protein